MAIVLSVVWCIRHNSLHLTSLVQNSGIVFDLLFNLCLFSVCRVSYLELASKPSTAYDGWCYDQLILISLLLTRIDLNETSVDHLTKFLFQIFVSFCFWNDCFQNKTRFFEFSNIRMEKKRKQRNRKIFFMFLTWILLQTQSFCVYRRPYVVSLGKHFHCWLLNMLRVDIACSSVYLFTL